MGNLGDFANKYGRFLEFYKNDLVINFGKHYSVSRFKKEKTEFESKIFIPTRIIGSKLYLPPPSAAKFLNSFQGRFMIKEENKPGALEIIKNNIDFNYQCYLASIVDRHIGRGKNPDADVKSFLRLNNVKITSPHNFGLLGFQTNSGKFKKNKEYNRLISLCGLFHNKVFSAIDKSDFVLIPLDTYLGPMAISELSVANNLTIPIYAYWNCKNKEFIINKYKWIISFCTRIFDSLDHFRRFTI